MNLAMNKKKIFLVNIGGNYGKNKMKGNQYLYQCNCGHQFISNKKWNNGEIYCPETDCKTCIEKRIK